MVVGAISEATVSKPCVNNYNGQLGLLVDLTNYWQQNEKIKNNPKQSPETQFLSNQSGIKTKESHLSWVRCLLPTYSVQAVERTPGLFYTSLVP